VNASETSIRLINLCYSLSFFLSSKLVDERFINDFREAVLLNSVFIENNLEFKIRRGSSYLINLLGLAFTGIIYKDHHYGKKLLNFVFHGFEQEIRSQIHNDGVSFEQSIPHQVLSLEALYLAKINLENYGYTFSSGFNDILYKMFDVHFNYLREDLSVPQIGDSISGRIVPFNIEDIKMDYSFPMHIGAYLLNEGKYKYNLPEGNAELLFLFGIKYPGKYKAITKTTPYYESKEYEEGGHYIIRTQQVHIFIEAGEIGNKGEGAPRHNDVFTFELFYKHKQFIVDPGTYSFYSDKE